LLWPESRLLTPIIFIIFGFGKVESKVKQFYGKTTTNPCKSVKVAQFQKRRDIKRNEKD
jgi:hypothetical protein